MKTWLFIFAILLLTFQYSCGQDIETLIKEGKADNLRYFLDQGNDINGLYSGYTLLESAIIHHKPELVKLLIEKQANVDQVNNNFTPLLFSVYFGSMHRSAEIIELLLANGANIDFQDPSGNTPLLLACKLNFGPAAKILFEHGADVTLTDNQGHDFFHYVIYGNDMELVYYFTTKGFPVPRTRSTTFGPFIKRTPGEKPEINRIVYDSLSDKAFFESNYISLTELQKTNPLFSGYELVTNKIGPKKRNKSTYKKVPKIFAVSDIHGNYEVFEGLLKESGIIGDNLNWKWGKGHLVINGDILDRGDKVTECLWLIYKLENQAEKSGGKVHFLLGNHEVMVIADNQKSYVHEKYIFPCAKLGIDYHDLLGEDYILGRWLRTKKVAVKINDILFVHGGIPPEYVASGQSIDEMNQAIFEYINRPADGSSQFNPDDLAIQPVWYRGYFEEENMENVIRDQLDYYKADKIVVGHTPVRRITPIQGGHVIAIGVPYDHEHAIGQGLLIEDGKLYIYNGFGEKNILFSE